MSTFIHNCIIKNSLIHIHLPALISKLFRLFKKILPIILNRQFSVHFILIYKLNGLIFRNCRNSCRVLMHLYLNCKKCFSYFCCHVSSPKNIYKRMMRVNASLIIIHLCMFVQFIGPSLADGLHKNQESVLVQLLTENSFTFSSLLLTISLLICTLVSALVRMSYISFIVKWFHSVA